MMKRFPIDCDFNGIKRTFHVWVGEPDPKRHPLDAPTSVARHRSRHLLHLMRRPVTAAVMRYCGTLKTATAWLSPFSDRSPISSSSALSSTAIATRRLTRIWPSLASAQSRAARLVTVPIAV